MLNSIMPSVILLNVTNSPFMQSVVKLNVFMLTVVVPLYNTLGCF